MTKTIFANQCLDCQNVPMSITTPEIPPNEEMITPVINDPLWFETAQCISTGENFFTEYPSTAERVRAPARFEIEDTLIADFCASCLVRQDCLAFSLRRKDEFGIWGGLTEEEREPLLDNMKRFGKITLTQWHLRHEYKTVPTDHSATSTKLPSEAIVSEGSRSISQAVEVSSNLPPIPSNEPMPSLSVTDIFAKYGIKGITELRSQLKQRQVMQRKLERAEGNAAVVNQLEEEITELYLCFETMREAKLARWSTSLHSALDNAS